ncbi:glycosyltransferase family 1 protein [Mycobacterium sp. GA-2829]|uniref:glycosyltransferase family 4 protein n=1 Tax=Mycobacterium sp. GA-2829 TaxID=1772283 RepID=UPI0007402706|nr:glycosyltransferase family 1 protein [Mycobacterium sp. GA-2829]KUI39755.1 glycosyl transferase family 1 [Mycobacterium sp. GA-2829]
MTAVHVNGKWLAQPLTGTQRYATEMVRGLVTSGAVDVVLHLPKGVDAPEWATGRPRVEFRHAPVGGVVFEQLYLPLATAGRLLLNFAGPAPLLKRCQLVTMHDATAFRYPRTFRPVFVAFYFVMYLLLARTARQVVTVSEFSAGELAAVLHVDRRRFLVIPCAADGLANIVTVRPDLDVDGDQYLVVGTLARHKNLTGTVAALTASGRRVVVVGAAGGDRVFSAISELGPAATVAGRLTDAELAWLYRNSRALVFPSRYEGFGLPLLEAQVLGCPVISSSAASLPEVGGQGALYFDPDDTNDLLVRLDEVETQPDIVQRLRERGHDNARRFSWQASADALLAWLGVESVVALHR